MDLDTVEAVACEAVDLVNDAIRHLMRGDIIEHAFQVWAVCGTGGLARVDKLGHNPRTQCGRLASVRFALRGDREAFIPTTLRRLLFGRDPLIGHRHESRCLLNQ